MNYLTLIFTALKAVGSAGVCAAAYLTGVLQGEDTLADVTTVQWLGLVVFVGAAYGITYRLPKRVGVRRGTE